MPRPSSDHPKLDRDTVVAAAVALVNAEGSDALSINRIARRLAVKPPSLYNHVGGLGGLQRELSLVNARNLGNLVVQAAIGRTGADAIESIARAYRAYILENSGLYFAGMRASGNMSEADPRLVEAEERVVKVVQTVLEPFRLSPEDSLHAVRGLRSLVHGFASLEAGGGFGLALDRDESFRRLVDLYLYGLERRRWAANPGHRSGSGGT